MHPVQLSLPTALVPVWHENLVFPTVHEDQNEDCDTAAGWKLTELEVLQPRFDVNL